MSTSPDTTPISAEDMNGGVAGLRRLVGRHLGYSDWVEISAERVKLFAEAIGDQNWIHTDTERAAAGRFGTPVAHGFLILSLTSVLLQQILVTPDVTMSVNYGCDRVRFLAPVPVGSWVRAGATLNSVDELPGGAQLSLTMVIQTRPRRVPVCVARVILRNYW